MTTLASTNNIIGTGNNVKLSMQEYATLFANIIAFARLAKLTWSDDLNGFKAFRTNDVLVDFFYSDEDDIKMLFIKHKNYREENYYLLREDMPDWAKELIKKAVFRSNFCISQEMLKKLLGTIPREWIAD